MLTVACVFKSFSSTLYGHSYDASWVQKLANGVKRNLTVPHRFVCLTNMGEIEGVETIPLTQDWNGWWSKIELFRPGLFTGPVLSLDLDVLFTGNIDPMAGPFDSMVMLKDVVPGLRNSTCMWWDASNPIYTKIYEAFAADPEGRKRIHSVMNQKSMGDQGLIADTLTDNNHTIHFWQDLLGEEKFIHFSSFSRINPMMQDVRATPDPFSYLNNVDAGVQMNEAIETHKPMVYCLGAPKFPNFTHLQVVKRHWF